MSMPISSPEPVSSSSSVAAGNKIATSATSQAGAVQANASTSQIDSSTTIRTLQDLQQKAPQLWQQMQVSIAMNICNDMQKAQERVKQMMRKGEQS